MLEGLTPSRKTQGSTSFLPIVIFIRPLLRRCSTKVEPRVGVRRSPQVVENVSVGATTAHVLACKICYEAAGGHPLLFRRGPERRGCFPLIMVGHRDEGEARGCLCSPLLMSLFSQGQQGRELQGTPCCRLHLCRQRERKDASLSIASPSFRRQQLLTAAPPPAATAARRGVLDWGGTTSTLLLAGSLRTRL